jgi:hypothetical protein
MAWESEVLGENLHQCYFVDHKSYIIRSGIQPGPQRWIESLPELWQSQRSCHILVIRHGVWIGNRIY